MTAIRRFFEGVVGFPFDNELLLQAYLFLNIDTLFPECDQLLLFEKPPYGDFTNKGKCDFVYLTTNQQLVLIETKYIDTGATGDTERKRRNKHRNKVISQVLKLKNTFCEHWQFQPDQIRCAVFTTDPSITRRSTEASILSQYVTIDDLNGWQRQAYGWDEESE